MMNVITHEAPVRETGYLLIADMESSTRSKFVLGETDAFNALRDHNRLVIAAGAWGRTKLSS